MLRKKVKITSEMARRIMGKTTRQRSVRLVHVAEIARDIMAGAWVYCPGICIDLDAGGGCVAGQHRLLACIMAGIAIESDIRTGVSTGERWKVPDPEAWSLRDRLRAEGHKNCSTKAALLLRLWRWLYRYPTASGRPTPREAKLLLDGAPGLDDAVTASVSLVKKFSAFRTTCVVLVYLFDHADTAAARRFWADAESCANLAAEDPVLVTRRYFDAPRAGKVGVSENRTHALWIKAWNARRNGQVMKLARWSAEEGFPEIDGLDLDALRKEIEKATT